MSLKLVFFNMEKGCGFCDKMRPIVAEYADKHPEVEVIYETVKSYNDVPEPFPKAVPLFVAYKDDQVMSVQKGMLPLERLEIAFEPEKIPPDVVPIEKASLLQLMQDEANIIDQLQPMLKQLKKIQAEMKKRRSLVVDDEPCCDGCAEGKGCGGH